MRFGIPRSPSPVREGPQKANSTSTRQLEDAMASIRLRSHYTDPYEEWERNVRKESFKAARKNYATIQSKLHDARQVAKTRDEERFKAHLALQRSELDKHLAKIREKVDAEKAAMVEQLKARETALWRNIDAAIAMDTKKAESKWAAEQKLRDEEDKRRKDAELKQRLAEESRRAEEEKKRSQEEAQRKAEEDKKRKEEEEAKKAQEDMERVEAEKKAKMEKMASERGIREQLGFLSAQDEWWTARKMMANLKTEVMPVVKNKSGNSADLKSAWSAHRRQITPKIGQLTENINDINRITDQITHIMLLPPSGHNPSVYYGLLSSLAKTIIGQAEAEVSNATESNPAMPIAQVTFNLLERLDGFGDVLWARLVTRTGGWAVPYPVGDADYDGRKWANQTEWKKANGYRQMQANDGSMVWETEEQYNTRIAGIMRVYFTVLSIKPVRQPLKGAMWQTPMFWRWIARLVGSDGGGRVMLEKSVAADVLAAGLQVLGSDAKAIWGNQFVKLLALVYEGVHTGFGDKSGGKIGGSKPEGSAARVRLSIEIERIMST
ncbi:GLE1-like protein-domain-containing protein [Mucidula mucida]|nr:GLE1-like protein-domain-containing protein [Mucidula mucida]